MTTRLGFRTDLISADLISADGAHAERASLLELFFD